MPSTPTHDQARALSRAIYICVGALTAIGLVAVYAASSLKGAQQFHDEFHFVRKQTLSAFVGLGCFVAIQKLPWKFIERLAIPVLALTIGLLALIFVPGAYSKVGGASRWLNLPFIGGQPAELAKLAMVLFLAKNLSRPSNDIDSFRRGILPNLSVLASLCGLLLFQKDLGTPSLLFLLTLVMLFVAGVARKMIVAASLATLLLATIAIILEPYRIQRILAFLDPWSAARGSGFQIIQSYLAFRNGGLLGAGLGGSRQKLFFLPEAHTDFILAVIGEELGLIGILVLVMLFAYLVHVGLTIARHQVDSHRRFLAFGLTFTIGVQAVMNMGVTMGLLPTKGMPLPFISSGNSSLLVFLAMSALLARLGKDSIPEGRHDSRPSTG